LQRADLQQRRRNRFKKIVVASVAAFVTLLMVMLIEGCVSQQARTATANPVAAH